MTLSAEEQQRLDMIVDFLTVYKWRIVAASTIAIAVLVVWFGYGSVRSGLIEDSSKNLASLQQAIDLDDAAEVDASFDRIIQIGVPDYIESAGLLVGGYRFWKEDKEGAVEAYREILSVSDDTGMRGLANLRLAQALIDSGKPEEGLKIASTQAYPPESTMRMLFEEVSGDALVAMGNFEEAGIRYTLVLQLLKPTHGVAYESLIISKLGLISQQGFDLKKVEKDA